MNEKLCVVMPGIISILCVVMVLVLPTTSIKLITRLSEQTFKLDFSRL